MIEHNKRNRMFKLHIALTKIQLKEMNALGKKTNDNFDEIYLSKKMMLR